MPLQQPVPKKIYSSITSYLNSMNIRIYILRFLFLVKVTTTYRRGEQKGRKPLWHYTELTTQANQFTEIYKSRIIYIALEMETVPIYSMILSTVFYCSIIWSKLQNSKKLVDQLPLQHLVQNCRIQKQLFKLINIIFI